MRTANPALSAEAFAHGPASDGRMSIQGTVNKSLFLILLVIAAACFSWRSAYPLGWTEGAVPAIPGWYLPVVLAGLVLALIIIFQQETAPVLTPIYAVLEGGALGALSAVFDHRFPGIVLQAVLCTFGVFFALLMAYKSRLIEPTENFKLGVFSATFGIAIVYSIDLILAWFGMRVPFIHDTGPLGIAVSIAVTGVAALNLVVDFDFVEKGAEQGAPKYMEWYGAFGLLVTLVWLYLEILRLLAKIRR
jgi:uncharacterized YccA/Bax inhibitor family protein